MHLLFSRINFIMTFLVEVTGSPVREWERECVGVSGDVRRRAGGRGQGAHDIHRQAEVLPRHHRPGVHQGERCGVIVFTGFLYCFWLF